MSEKAGSEFWASLEAAAARVEAWPEWKKIMFKRARDAEEWFHRKERGALPPAPKASGR